MLLRPWRVTNPRLLIGATLLVVGSAGLYNAMWLMLVFPPGHFELWFQTSLWLWPMSVIVILVGLLTLTPGRGRTIGWYCFVLFVLANAIPMLVRGLDFDDRILWW